MPPCADPRPVGPGSARGARAPRRGLPLRGLGPRGLRVVLPCAACLEQEPAAGLARPSRAPLPEDGLARLRTGGASMTRLTCAPRRPAPRLRGGRQRVCLRCMACFRAGLVLGRCGALGCGMRTFLRTAADPSPALAPRCRCVLWRLARAGLPTGLCATLPLLWWSREAE